jgi:3-hydroxyisobutyrate dehydrogenase-like beta-hydroxyacid dehydrogenase
MTTVAVLHPGRMGAAVAAQLRTVGTHVLWCSPGRSAGTVERAEAAGLEDAGDLRDLLARADVVLSICPPEFAESVASQVSAIGFGGLYVEANAISPQRATRINDLVDLMIDGCIFGAPPTGGSTIDLYLSGPSTEAKKIADLFAGTRVFAKVLDGPVGKASALKMAQATFQKASRALAAVALAFADQHGVREELLIEAERLKHSVMTQPQTLPSVAARAWRWESEMTEVAEALEQAGLPVGFADAAAEVFSRWRADKDDFDLTVDALLARLTAGNPPS